MMRALIARILLAVKASGVNEHLQFATLASSDAVIERTLMCVDLRRFAALATSLEDLHVRLAFGHTEDGRVSLHGKLGTRVAVECHRCLEEVPITLETEFDVLIVREDEEATLVGAEQDVLQAATDQIAIGELIEDELILALPAKVCVEVDCANAPELAYPAGAAEGGKTDNPFQVLERLKMK